jgi:hypothetical protein
MLVRGGRAENELGIGQRLEFRAYARRLRRQGDPQLEAARSACFVEAAAVPHAASSLHPFDAAGPQCASDIVRIDVADRAFHDISQSGDTRVGCRSALNGAPS